MKVGAVRHEIVNVMDIRHELKQLIGKDNQASVSPPFRVY